MNLAGWNGNTPLHASAMGGKPDAARLLLARGADPLRKNRAGETALDIARRLREPGMEEHIIEIVELLEGAEAVAVTERAEVAAAELEAAGAAMDAPGTYRGKFTPPSRARLSVVFLRRKISVLLARLRVVIRVRISRAIFGRERRSHRSSF